MPIKLTAKEIGMLAALERDMENGLQPYVVDKENNRWAFPPEVLVTCGCESGQPVSNMILHALMKENLSRLQAKIDNPFDIESNGSVDSRLKEVFDWQEKESQL